VHKKDLKSCSQQ